MKINKISHQVIEGRILTLLKIESKYYLYDLDISRDISRIFEVNGIKGYNQFIKLIDTIDNNCRSMKK